MCGAPLDDCANAGLCMMSGVSYSHACGECGFGLGSWSYSKEWVEI